MRGRFLASHHEACSSFQPRRRCGNSTLKTPKFNPELALICGLFVAPAACALNSLVLQLLIYGTYRRIFVDSLNVGFSSLILTFPLGWISARLIEIWRKGRFASARLLGLAFGLFSVALVRFLWTTFSATWRAPDIGALAVPFLWSISLLIFALFARAPKS